MPEEFWPAPYSYSCIFNDLYYMIRRVLSLGGTNRRFTEMAPQKFPHFGEGFACFLFITMFPIPQGIGAEAGPSNMCPWLDHEFHLYFMYSYNECSYLRKDIYQPLKRG